MIILGFFILGALLALGMLLYTDKSININIKHTHIVDHIERKTELDKADPIEKQMTSMVEAFNTVLNGEDFYGEGE